MTKPNNFRVQDGDVNILGGGAAWAAARADAAEPRAKTERMINALAAKFATDEFNGVRITDKEGKPSKEVYLSPPLRNALEHLANVSAYLNVGELLINFGYFQIAIFQSHVALSKSHFNINIPGKGIDFQEEPHNAGETFEALLKCGVKFQIRGVPDGKVPIPDPHQSDDGVSMLSIVRALATGVLDRSVPSLRLGSSQPNEDVMDAGSNTGSEEGPESGSNGASESDLNGGSDNDSNDENDDENDDKDSVCGLREFIVLSADIFTSRPLLQKK